MSLSKQRRDGTETQAGTENKTEDSDRKSLETEGQGA